MAENRTQIISSTLCKHLSLNSNDFVGEVEKGDVKSLCTEILKFSPKSSSLLSNDEVIKWIAFADNFPLNSEECLSSLNGLNDVLAHKSVLLGDGFKVSEVDVIVYSAIHSCLVAMSDSAKKNFTHVLRWADYVQNKVDLGSFLEKIPVEKIRFEPPAPKSAINVEANLNPRDVSKDVKADSNTKKDTGKGSNGVGVPATDTTVKKAKNDKKATGSEQKKPEPVAASKDDVPVSLLNIQVGLIRKAQKHPSADSLLVEEIDVGESKVRQVVSGLAKFCNPDDLVNRRVALITNVKPGKLRDIVSEGLVLCASNEDHSVVEPLLPPESAQIGERVSFSGHDGKPEDVLNPKKKQFDKITPHLFTDDNGVATYKGIPFMTSAGPCTSSIRKGSIK